MAPLFLDRDKDPVDIVAYPVEVVLEKKQFAGIDVTGVGLVFVSVGDAGLGQIGGGASATGGYLAERTAEENMG